MVDVRELTKFAASGRALRLVMDIAAALERYKIVMEGPKGVRLRKLNRIRTIHGTTAIEGNTLTEADVTAILAGKRVAGSKREIAEVKGAFAAYAAVEKLDPLSSKDLLKAHGLMTAGLVDNPGKWRKCNVGVFNARGEAMHHAPPWDHVPLLMKDLFSWLKRSRDVPLVKSCIFHFVFETIHPFPDGNGRMGRLWQTAILGRWNPLFYAAPVENMVLCHQRQYYHALHESQVTGDAALFVEFMLGVILRTIKAKGEQKDGQNSREKGREKSREKILNLLKADPRLTQADLAKRVKLSVKAIEKNIRRLKDEGRLCRIGPDKGGHWEVVK